MTTRIPRRYHRIDGWRGFWIPGTAVAGVSDTGTWSDSPCPTPAVKAELRALAEHHGRRIGIASFLEAPDFADLVRNVLNTKEAA